MSAQLDAIHAPSDYPSDRASDYLSEHGPDYPSSAHARGYEALELGGARQALLQARARGTRELNAAAAGPADRLALLDAIHTMLGRRLSVYAERRRCAIATHHGLSTCDLRVLDQIVELGPLTTGQLTRVSGLSAGNITAIVDRLEASGMIHRTKHPIDRRITLLDADMQRYAALQAQTGTRLPRPADHVHVTPQGMTQVHAFLSHYLGDRRDGALLEGGDPHAN